MSHFTKVTTQIRHIDALREALTTLRCTVRGAGNLKGWQGRVTKADCIAVLPGGGEIGFCLQPDGSYALVADWQTIGGQEEAVGRTIKREYSAAVATASLRRQGIRRIERTVATNGNIVITGFAS